MQELTLSPQQHWHRFFESQRWTELTSLFAKIFYKEPVKPQIHLLFHCNQDAGQDNTLTIRNIGALARRIDSRLDVTLICKHLQVDLDLPEHLNNDIVELLPFLENISAMSLIEAACYFPSKPILSLLEFEEHYDYSTEFFLSKDVRLEKLFKLVRLDISLEESIAVISKQGHAALPSLKELRLSPREMTVEHLDEIDQFIIRHCPKLSTFTLILGWYRPAEIKTYDAMLCTMKSRLTSRNTHFGLHLHMRDGYDRPEDCKLLVPCHDTLLGDVTGLFISARPALSGSFLAAWSLKISLPSLNWLCMDAVSLDIADTLQWRLNNLVCPALESFRVEILQNPIFVSYLTPLLWQLPGTCKWKISGLFNGDVSLKSVPKAKMLESQELAHFRATAKRLGIECKEVWVDY